MTSMQNTSTKTSHTSPQCNYGSWRDMLIGQYLKKEIYQNIANCDQSINTSSFILWPSSTTAHTVFDLLAHAPFWMTLRGHPKVDLRTCWGILYTLVMFNTRSTYSRTNLIAPSFVGCFSSHCQLRRSFFSSPMYQQRNGCPWAETEGDEEKRRCTNVWTV